jgi:hypothetical protein
LIYTSEFGSNSIIGWYRGESFGVHGGEMRRSRRIFWLGFVLGTFAACLATVASGAVRGHAITPKVTVTFTDRKLVVSRGHLEAGAATVVLVNDGRKAHVLTIRGPGLKGVRTQKVAAGGTATLTIRLTTGAYQLADPAGVLGSNVRWLVVSPATVVQATGNGSVVVPLNDPTRMDCD